MYIPFFIHSFWHKIKIIILSVSLVFIPSHGVYCDSESHLLACQSNIRYPSEEILIKIAIISEMKAYQDFLNFQEPIQTSVMGYDIMIEIDTPRDGKGLEGIFLLCSINGEKYRAYIDKDEENLADKATDYSVHIYKQSEMETYLKHQNNKDNFLSTLETIKNENDDRAGRITLSYNSDVMRNILEFLAQLEKKISADNGMNRGSIVLDVLEFSKKGSIFKVVGYRDTPAVLIDHASNRAIHVKDRKNQTELELAILHEIFAKLGIPEKINNRVDVIELIREEYEKWKGNKDFNPKKIRDKIAFASNWKFDLAKSSFVDMDVLQDRDYSFAEFQDQNKREEENNEYIFLTDSEFREAMIEGIIVILKESKKRKIKTVFVNGISAKPVAQFYRLCWQKFYPEETPPSFVFLDDAGKDERYKKEKVKGTIRSMEDLTYVVENPVLVLDDTYCLGFTLDTTKEILVNEFNAKQVFTAGLFRLLPHYSEDPSRLKKADFYGVFLPDKAEKAPYFWHTVRAWINDRSFGRDDFLSLFEKTKEQEREIFEKYLPHDLSILASEAEVVFKASKDLQNPGRGYQNAEEIINDRIKEWDGITVDFKKQEKKPFEIRNFSGFSEKAGDFKDLLNEVYNNILPEEVRNIIRLQQPPNNGIINIGVSSTLQSNVAKIISPETGEVWVLFDERFVKEILYKSDDTISADMSPEEIEFSSQWLLMERFYVFMYSNYVPAFNAIRDGTDDFLIESFGMGETLQASIKNELDQILNKTYDIGKAGKEKREGLLFVVSGPSGSGKTTIVNSSLKKLQNTALRLKRSISSTTRKQRRDEVDGIDYRFLSEEEFFEKINKNEFLEWTQIFGDYYGTELNFIDDASKRGEDLMLVIDVEGFRKIKKIIPEGIGIFILPPEDTEQLRRRLIKRGDNTPAEIEIRLARTKYELNEGQDYNYQIINDDLDEAVSDFNAIIEMETKKAEKLAGYIPEEIAKDEKRLHRHVFSLAEEVWVIRTFNRLIGYLQSREYSIQEIISRRMKDYNKRVPNSNNRFSSAKFYHPQSGLLSFMLGGERDADKKLIRAVISRHSFYDDDLFVKSMPSKTANDEKVLDGKWVVYDNALQETERIHMKNLEITPECDEKKILCHIIIDSIFSSGQKKVLKTLEQDMRDEKYREKIVSLSIDRDRDFEEQVKREMQNQRDLYKGYTVIFDIACPSIDDVRDMLKDGPDIKALAFSPETADEGNFIQIESIMAALRVLHADDLNRIKEVIESLTGEELDIEKRGIKTIDDFIKTVIITLPSIRVIDYYDFKNLNDIMVKSIKSAA